jgi:hypothetical protein
LPADGPEGERLRADAAAAWRLAADVLGRHGVLSALDGAALTDFAVCSARVLECEWAIDGRRRHPLSGVAAAYRADRDRWAAELGISRAVRARLGVVDRLDDDPAGILDT